MKETKEKEYMHIAVTPYALPKALLAFYNANILDVTISQSDDELTLNFPVEALERVVYKYKYTKNSDDTVCDLGIAGDRDGDIIITHDNNSTISEVKRPECYTYLSDKRKSLCGEKTNDSPKLFSKPISCADTSDNKNIKDITTLKSNEEDLKEALNNLLYNNKKGE